MTWETVSLMVLKGWEGLWEVALRAIQGLLDRGPEWPHTHMRGRSVCWAKFSTRIAGVYGEGAGFEFLKKSCHGLGRWCGGTTLGRTEATGRHVVCTRVAAGR